MVSSQEVYLHEIATAVPEHYYTQAYALQLILELMGDTPAKRSFFTKVYQSTAIEKRHTVISDYGKNPQDYQFYPKNSKMLPEPDTETRNDLYIKEASRLALHAVKRLLEKLNHFDISRITHLITVSCTGFSAPGFDLTLTRELKLSPHINRFHLGFMGCYAAFPAMKMAKSFCQSDPQARVLVVNVELCSLHFQQSQEPDIMVANALFADGVSAALISAVREDSEGPKIALHHFLTTYLQGSEEDMAWKIGSHGFDMKLSAYVPRLLKSHINPIMDKLYAQAQVTPQDISFWAIHPGGKAILEKLADTLELSKEDLAIPYQILRDYGNMSSSTIMFVLEQVLASKENGKIISAGFGPGLTVEAAVMEKGL